jgi:hypothetical protein
MKKLGILLLFGAISFHFASAQSYVPFPTGLANWNCLFWHQWEPNTYYLTNYQYIQQGDTILKGKSYKKVFSKNLETPEPNQYIGGLREGENRDIYFFPVGIHLPTTAPITFPNDTTEQLLYTFANLSVGMTLPINAGYTDIKVVGIDSILMGNEYRKRYAIQNGMIWMPEYWIEGIGSDLELFSPFSLTFEWRFYTLCFSEIDTYYINSPNGADSCHYSVNSGIEENELQKIQFYPNPATDVIKIDAVVSNGKSEAIIYSTQGQMLQNKRFDSPKTELDVRELKPGVYFLRVISEKGNRLVKFVKK